MKNDVGMGLLAEQKECSESFSCAQVEVRARVSDQLLEDACRYGCPGMDMCISTCST